MVVEFIHKRLPQKVRDSWPINRVLSDLLIILVVILGFLVVDQRKIIEDTQDAQADQFECIRTFLVDQGKAQNPRTKANEQTDIALANAIKTIPPLLQAILKSAANPTDPNLEQESLDAVTNTNNAFNDFNKNFEELQLARELFPANPVPEDLCKDVM